MSYFPMHSCSDEVSADVYLTIKALSEPAGISQAMKS